MGEAEGSEAGLPLGALAAFARAGLSDASIAGRLGMTAEALAGLLARSEAARAALAEGRGAYHAVEEALFRMSTGYVREVTRHFKEVVREFDPGTGKKVRETETAVPRVDEVYVPPSVTAAVYWLSHRTPEAWAERDDEQRLVRAVQAMLGKVEEEVRGEGQGDAGALPQTPPREAVPPLEPST